MKQNRNEGLWRLRVAFFVTLLLVLSIVAVRSDTPAEQRAEAERITVWIHANVEYVASPDRIKNPTETLLDGGDCADMSALLVSMLNDAHVRAAQLLLIDLRDFEEHHAVVELYGWIFDPTTGAVFRGSFPLAHEIRFEVGFSNLLADWK